MEADARGESSHELRRKNFPRIATPGSTREIRKTNSALATLAALSIGKKLKSQNPVKNRAQLCTAAFWKWEMDLTENFSVNVHST